MNDILKEPEHNSSDEDIRELNMFKERTGITDLGKLVDMEVIEFTEVIKSTSMGFKCSLRVLLADQYKVITRMKNDVKTQIKEFPKHGVSNTKKEYKETYSSCLIMLARIEGKFNILERLIKEVDSDMKDSFN